MPWKASDVFVGGAVVQWLRDGLGLIRKSEEVEALRQVRSRQRRSIFRSGIRRIGCATGIRTLEAQFSDSPAARLQATWPGLPSRALLTRSRTLLDAMRKDSGNRTRTSRGWRERPMTTSCSFRPTFSEYPLFTQAVTETTALGAAYLAGLGVGFWHGNIDANAGKERRFEPKMQASQARSLRERWNEAVSRSKNWESAG